jgi:hypothetical protein
MAAKSKQEYRDAAKAKVAEEKRMDAVVSTHGENCQCVFHRAERAKAAR